MPLPKTFIRHRAGRRPNIVRVFRWLSGSSALRRRLRPLAAVVVLLVTTGSAGAGQTIVTVTPVRLAGNFGPGEQASGGTSVPLAPDSAQQETAAAIPVGIVRMQNDPESRSVQGGAAVGNMTYHGGPVQHIQKIFTIFWGTGSSFPAGYQATINQFVQDLSGSPYYAIAGQYGDMTGSIAPSLSYGGTWLDTTNIFPNAALSYSDLLAEVNRAKIANGWTSDANTYFQVYTPSGIASAFGGICGVHFFGNPAVGQILFPQPGCFSSGPYPNNLTVDMAIAISAHEIMETVTDPQGDGWYFVDHAGEIGDLCAWNFGARAGDGSNVTLNGHNYVIQQEWSNAVSGCAMSFLGSKAVMTSPAPGTPLGPNVTFTWSSGVGVTYYDLNIGSTPGGRDLFDAMDGVFTTASVTGLPTDGRPLYVTLWSWIAPSWQANQYVYTASRRVRDDFDGDGKTDPAVYRPSSGTWYVKKSSTDYTTYLAQQWGLSGDIPVRGDFDGDGKPDMAVYRPSDGTWWILESSTNYTTYRWQQWGLTGDIPVPGDFDGDGKTDMAVYRPSTGTWYVKSPAPTTRPTSCSNGG